MAYFLAARPHPVTELVTDLVRRESLRRPFNPSIVLLSEDLIVGTLRSSDAERRTRTTLFVLDLRAREPRNVLDLSAHNRELQVGPTNDAKLFTFDGAVFATFNTGHPRARSEQNAIYVQSVFPQVGEPLFLHIEHRKNRLEKNVMFEQIGTGLFGTYVWDSDPVVIERTSSSWVLPAAPSRSAAATRLQDASSENQRARRSVSYGQGTPWVDWRGARVSVVHEKQHLGPVRSYRGRLAKREPDGTVAFGATLYHSRLARLGPVRRRNPRLLHATYFSGLTASSESLLVSYGINDNSFGIAEIGDLA